MKKYDVILFDLDGTLLDSLEDMKDSVNHVMRDFGYPEHTLAEVRSYIGDGIRKLIERALPPDAGDEIRYGPHGGGFVAALGADFHFGAVFEPQCQERKNAHGTGLPGRGAQGDPGGRKPPD